MRVIIATDFRFAVMPDRSVWSSSTFAYSFWRRYLEVFEGVCILARMQAFDAPGASWKRVDGPGVDFSPIPSFIGPWQYVMRLAEIKKVVKSALVPDSAVILRVPSSIASIAGAELIRAKRPFGVEVLGDPWESLGPGAVRHFLRPIFRWRYTRLMKNECASAVVAAYVTRKALQKRYPPSPNAFTIDYSDIELKTEDMRSRPPRPIIKRPAIIVLVGSLEQHYKGVDVLLRAIGRLVGQGIDVEARILGDGRCRLALQAFASKLGIEHKVRFLGHLPGPNSVRQELEKADIFTMPSRTEGMPRALIEAMACGLPCIASAIGGIGELLPDEDLVPVGDDRRLAESLRRVILDEQVRSGMSARNSIRAMHFLEEGLKERWLSAYRALLKASG